MMVKENEVVKERIYVNTLSSGTKCYIIPKCDYQEKMAMIAVEYGSNDLLFHSAKGEKKSPEGMAHFLEHKLFEEEWGNVFETFSQSGAQANAFTDCNKTTYYFSCTEDFQKNFEILLNFVQSPYFTEESTEREKGIISQEITMFDDDPNWKVYFNMLRGMYHNHPVKIQIAGSVNSIQKIDADILYDCYEAFYTPKNMTIVCVGDLDPEKVLDQAEKLMKKNGPERTKTIYQEEPQSIVKEKIEETMDVSEPIFYIGYKGTPTEKSNPQKIYAMKLLMDLIAGESSFLYQSLYTEDLLNENFGLQYLSGKGFSFSVFAGSTKYPDQVAQRLSEQIEKLKKEGIAEENFMRLKKKHMGRFLRGFNSVNAIGMSQIENGVKGFDLMDVWKALENCKKEDLELLLKEEFCLDRQVVSIIQNKE